MDGTADRKARSRVTAAMGAFYDDEQTRTRCRADATRSRLPQIPAQGHRGRSCNLRPRPREEAACGRRGGRRVRRMDSAAFAASGNLQGKFNVPKGTKTNVILSTDDFQSISNALKNATLLSADFEDVIENSASGDFVFIDPPYTVKHNVNGFIKYNERIFRWEDQIRLASAVARAAKRNVKILITNANHESIRNLYRDVGYLKKLSRFSVLAGDRNSRGKTTELAIMINYEPEEGSHVCLS